ncbi:unnamed protein product, partial [Rotaria magnacalcarata]
PRSSCRWPGLPGRHRLRQRHAPRIARRHRRGRGHRGRSRRRPAPSTANSPAVRPALDCDQPTSPPTNRHRYRPTGCAQSPQAPGPAPSAHAPATALPPRLNATTAAQ